MRDQTEQLERPSTSTLTVTQRLIEGYTAEIEARRLQLNEDLALYRRRLGDLAQLDPLDFTGLAQLYRTHVSQIEALLQGFDNRGDGR